MKEMISSYTIRTNDGNVYPQRKDLSLRQEVFKECMQNFKTDFANINYKEILLDKAVIIIRDDSINVPLFMDLKYRYERWIWYVPDLIL